MCRALVDAGFPDGAIEFRERARFPLRHSFASIFAHAKLPLYGYIDPVMANELRELALDATRWATLDLTTQTYLRDREQVVIEADQPVLTDFGRDTVRRLQFAPERPTEPPVVAEGADFTALSSEEIRRVAASINLAIDGKSPTTIAALLKVIDRTIQNKTLEQIEYIALRGGVRPAPMRGRVSETKRKRRIVAAVINSGKISWL